MPSSPAPLSSPRPAWQPTDLLRALVALALVIVIFSIGIYSDSVLASIDQFWLRLLTLIGLGHYATTIQQGLNGLVTKRSLVSVGTYSLLYTGACLLLLVVVLKIPRRIRLALVLYAATFAICAALVVAGKLAGDAAWAYKLARRLIDFIVSPLPVIMLVPLLRWYLPATAPAATKPA